MLSRDLTSAPSVGYTLHYVIQHFLTESHGKIIYAVTFNKGILMRLGTNVLGVVTSTWLHKLFACRAFDIKSFGCHAFDFLG